MLGLEPVLWEMGGVGLLGPCAATASHRHTVYAADTHATSDLLNPPPPPPLPEWPRGLAMGSKQGEADCLHKNSSKELLTSAKKVG
ncbi:hypothetical protein EYF80_000721 [Liparis tanakae]|uniref:Uncharacterized protein n=1 Tax=Liparis tanakae TaxID=230148 RepID=A0A4Z2JG74_9TELE|nr:hypothetical protein EYF80_000721 [Liparis tanakae]